MEGALARALEKIYARYIPEKLRDPLDEYYRARVFVLVCLVGTLLLLPFCILRFMLQGVHTYPIVLTLTMLLILSAPGVLKRTQSLPAAGLFLVVVMASGFMTMSFFDGGIKSPTVFALLLTPLFAIIFGDNRRGVAGTIVITLALVLLALATGNGWCPPVGLPPDLYTWFLAGSGIAVMIILVSMAYLFLQWQKTVNEGLRVASTAKDAFLSGMSHELRTPINSMMGFADVLAHEYPGPLNDRQKEHVGLILKSGEHLTELVEDLVNLTNLDAGKLVLAHEPVNFAELLQSCADAFAIVANEKGIRIEVTIGDIPTPIVVDDTRIRQVLSNLLSNAIKFSPANDVIRMEVKRNGPIIEVTVADSGPGIAPEHRDLVFEKFFQVDSALSGKTVGSGLGLYIARRLTELHGGRLNLANSVDGTTFVLAIPVKPITESKDAAV